MKMRPLVFSVLAMCVSAGTAGAHAMLDHSTPGAGAVVDGSLGAVQLWFTQTVKRNLSGASVTGPSGQTVGEGSVSSRNQITVPLPRLPAGSYRVNWHAVSGDSHHTEGSFTFQVK